MSPSPAPTSHIRYAEPGDRPTDPVPTFVGLLVLVALVVLVVWGVGATSPDDPGDESPPAYTGYQEDNGKLNSAAKCDAAWPELPAQTRAQFSSKAVFMEVCTSSSAFFLR